METIAGKNNQQKDGGLPSLVSHDITGNTYDDKFLRVVFSNSPIGVYLVQDRKFKFVNPEFCRQTGYSEDELLSAASLDLVHPDDRDIASENAIKMLKGQQSWPYEFRVTNKSGEIRWILETVSPIQYKGRRAVIGNFMDITKRKWAEEALRESRASFYNIVERSADGIVVTDKEGTVLFVNRTLETILNRKSEELIGEMFGLPVISGETTEIDIVGKTGEPGAGEMCVVETEWEGEPACLISLHDITERRQAERDLMIKDKAIASSLNVIGIADFDGNLNYANPSFLKMWGYDSEGEILGKSISEFWPTEEQVQKAISAIYEKSSWQGELVINRTDGSGLYGQLSVSPVIDSSNRPIAMMISFIDLTERRQMENEIKHAAEEWRATFDSMDEYISIHDKDYKIVRVNRGFAKAFKLEPIELLGKYCYELFHGTKAPCLDCPYERAVATKKPAMAEFFEPQLGIHIEITISPIFNELGEIIGCVHIARDITERRQAQQAQERLSQQLQDKISELEAFSYGIAHDLRSPMLSIEGLSRLLREDILNQKVENVQEDVRLLESGVKKMQQFLNRTLEYSRAGKLVKSPRNISFDKLVREVVSEFTEQLNSVEATISVPDTFPGVCVDRMRIKEVLTNLIQNSINYRDKATPLKIEIGHCLSKEKTVFFVRDNGSGIDKYEVKKVFSLFYRGTSDSEGSGIGLAIVKRIIEAHGGKIWIEQGQAGKGTVVCFTLPQQSRVINGGNNGKD